MRHSIKNAIARFKRLEQRPFFVMTVGLPGSGKSTFLKLLGKELREEIVIASTDDVIEREGLKLGLTYSEAFKQISQTFAKREFNAAIAAAVKAGKNIAIDQTNVGGKSRRTKLEPIPQSYFKICLVFDVPDAVLRERLDKRAAETGKFIPEFVVKQMTNSWQTPSLSDGFNEIIEIVQ